MSKECEEGRGAGDRQQNPWVPVSSPHDFMWPENTLVTEVRVFILGLNVIFLILLFRIWAGKGAQVLMHLCWCGQP